MGLAWAIKKIGERIHPTPMFAIQEGVLHCETVCLGAKPVFEVFSVGESKFTEPNQGVDYDVDAWWEDDDEGRLVYVASRRHPAVNGGRPTVKRVYIDRLSGEMTIATAWGGKRDFIATFTRRH